eukprot:5761062-Amphidinium_carterae.1
MQAAGSSSAAKLWPASGLEHLILIGRIVRCPRGIGGVTSHVSSCLENCWVPGAHALVHSKDISLQDVQELCASCGVNGVGAAPVHRLRCLTVLGAPAAATASYLPSSVEVQLVECRAATVLSMLICYIIH